MSDKIFLDSNTWIYIFADEKSFKARTAKQFITNTVYKDAIVTSFQVINEVGNVLRRKKLSEQTIRETIEALTKICLVQNFTKDILLMASQIREHHSFSYWDSLIVATASFSGCNMIISEDMQNGRIIEDVKIKNIFI